MIAKVTHRIEIRLVIEAAEKHQAPFLLGVTWDTVKPCEKLVEGGLQAVVRRVSDDFATAMNTLNEQIAQGSFACAVFVAKNSLGSYSVRQIGSCDVPPLVALPTSSRGPLDADPTKVGTVGVSTLIAPEALALALGGFDPTVARDQLLAELNGRKWPTAPTPRYVVTGSLKEAACQTANVVKTKCFFLVAGDSPPGSRPPAPFRLPCRG